jgi:antibiotic biosynthesis monooxygenase (ABM) superfamily enzyme
MSSDPITVSIRREVDPDHNDEATAWAQTGITLAHRYPGFLGSGWVRDRADSNVWHMLYRFADEETLNAWEQSKERDWWRSAGDGFVRSERTRRRSGIEGWFDEPNTDTITLPRADGSTTTMSMMRTPPRWKQAVSIWLGFFPLNVAFTYALSPVPGWNDLPIWLRVLGMTLVLTPLMTYWVLPWVTRVLRTWLDR